MADVLYDVTNGVARITLNRPDAGNAVSLEMARELMQATIACSGAGAGVRAVLLRGAGPRFCVGGDVKAFAGQADLPAYLRETTAYLHAALSHLARLPAPVVTAVQGSAAGAGLSLAAAGDLVLAASSTKFVMAYTRIGMSPDGSATWSLPRMIGLRRALELAITNRVLSAEEAVEWGLATRAVPDDQLDTEADALVADLAAGATGAMGHAKRLLRGSLDETLETQMELEAIAIAECAATPDGQEGIAAFVEKRTPTFRGS